MNAKFFDFRFMGSFHVNFLLFLFTFVEYQSQIPANKVSDHPENSSNPQGRELATHLRKRQSATFLSSDRKCSTPKNGQLLHRSISSGDKTFISAASNTAKLESTLTYYELIRISHTEYYLLVKNKAKSRKSVP